MSIAGSINQMNQAVLRVLGEACVIHGTSGYVSINAIFDWDYIEDSQINGYKPVLHCRAVDVENIPLGSTYTSDGADYTVIIKQAESGGMTKLILEAQ